jgi:hypothetical protein
VLKTNTTIMNRSNELYSELLTLTTHIPSQHLFHNQLKFGQLNEVLYEQMYEMNKRDPGNGVIAEPRSVYQGRVNALTTLCNQCRSFHYSAQQTKVYDKQNDILKASFFEGTIQQFLNNKGIFTVRGDEENQYVQNHKGFPDLLVLNRARRPFCYIEVKYNAAPFIKVRDFVAGRECYEGSLTLNPQKLQRQKELIETEINVPVYYVYWADFPCLKGLFATRIENIWNYYSNQGNTHQHNRRTGTGDFSYGRRTGQTEIIYPPILEMMDLETFFNVLQQANQ